jgi:TPR repeat protein
MRRREVITLLGGAAAVPATLWSMVGSAQNPAVPDWLTNLADGSVAYGNGDCVTALRLLRPLADKGQCIAQSNLGSMYKFGWGVPQDYVVAHMWFNLSAAQGCILSSLSAAERDDLASRMTKEQIAEAQRLAREWKPK